jgi:uncharacterized protein with GYD domain
MPLYLSTFTYEPRTWAKLIYDSSNRREGVRETVEAVGGSLRDFWYTMGDQDGYVMFECPDDQAAMTFLSVSYSRGNLRSIKTSKLFTVEEMVSSLEAAGELPNLPERP